MTDEHGNQELRGLIGERLDQVPPGFLPRTTDELNAEYSSSSFQHDETPSEDNTQSSVTFEDHDTALAASLELNLAPEDSLFFHPTLHSPYQARSVGRPFSTINVLWQELLRVRIGIEQVMSGLQELGETAPNSQEAVDQASVLDNRIQEINGRLGELQQTRLSPTRRNTLSSAITPQNDPTSHHGAATTPSNQGSSQRVSSNIRASVEAAQGHEAIARAERDTAALALQRSENEVQAAMRARRSILRTQSEQGTVARVFGAREEVERQGADYESPIGGMSTRAHAHYRAAEEAQEGGNPQGAAGQERTSNRMQQRPQEVGRRRRIVADAGETDRSDRHFSPSVSLSPLSVPQSTIPATRSWTPGGIAAPYRPTAYGSTSPGLSQSATPATHNIAQGGLGSIHRLNVAAYTPTSPAAHQRINSTAHSQRRGSFSGLSPHLASDATVLDSLVPPFPTGMPQQLTLQADSIGQAQRPASSLQTAHQYSHVTEDFDGWRGRRQAEATSDPSSMDWTPSLGLPEYSVGPLGVNPRSDPSATSQSTGHRYSAYMPQYTTNTYTPTTYAALGGSHQNSASNTPPDFSTIASDAARMQGTASQAHRRIIRDPRGHHHGPMPSAMPGLLDSNPTTSGASDPRQYNLPVEILRYRPSRHSRSEESASDSSDATQITDRIRRRRNAVGETENSLSNVHAALTSEAVEETIANFRARRQAGLSAAIDQILDRDDPPEQRGPLGLDRDDGRPAPRPDGDMMVNMECKICFSQMASVAVLPCGKQMLRVLLSGIWWGLFDEFYQDTA